jgi:hypothetical protein
VEGQSYEREEDLAERLAKDLKLSDWQVVVIHNNAAVGLLTDKFLWATWTRFNPATDLHSAKTELINNHISYSSPIVIDARMKPWYPKEVEPLGETVELVDKRWGEYFSKNE